MTASPISLVLVCASVVACAHTPPQVIAVTAAQELVKPSVMTVTGTATLEVTPDIIDLAMTVSADDPRPSAATHALQGKRDALLDALSRVDVSRDDVKLSLVTLEPIYDRGDTSWEPVHVRTYRAELTISATTRKLERIGAIMDAAASAGVSRMFSSFRRSDLPQLKVKVRDMAVAAARSKAQQIADRLDVKLGRVVAVSEASARSEVYSSRLSNTIEVNPHGAGLVAASEPLTLDITLGFELAAK